MYTAEALMLRTVYSTALKKYGLADSSSFISMQFELFEFDAGLHACVRSAHFCLRRLQFSFMI